MSLKKTGIFLVPILILIFSFITGTDKEVIQQQTYIPKVIINAPWADKNVHMDKEASPEGEFGIYDPYTRDPKASDQGPIKGPSTFTIAPNGDIYIVDTFNHRIQRFTQDGSFVAAFPAVGSGWAEDIAVDESGNVYLLFLGPAQVWKSDQEGNRLKIIYTFKQHNHPDEDARGMNIGGGSTRLYCDNSGRLFLTYYKENERAQVIFQLGTTTTEFTPEQQKTTLRRGSAGMSGIILNKDQIFQYIDGQMYSVDNSDKKVTGYRFLGTYSFLDVDGSGNAYMTHYNMDIDIYSVRKQTPNGEVISTFEWKYPRYQLPPPHGTTSVRTNKKLMVDTQGNVYVLGLTESGVAITKWSPSSK